MLLALLLAPVAGAQTFVVDDDGGPGVDFTDLPAAVAAASDGDRVLLREGVYTHFVLDGKGLILLGDGAATTFVSQTGIAGRSTRITDLPAGSMAYVDGMTFESVSTSGDFALQRVFVGGAATRATFAAIAVEGTPNDVAFRVDGARVNLVDSSVTGRPLEVPGPHGGAPGLTALEIVGGAEVHVAGSTLRGGMGGRGENGGSGGTAVVVDEESRAWFAASRLEGGDGAFGFGNLGHQGRALVAQGGSHVRVSGGGDALVVGGSGDNEPPLASLVAEDAVAVVHDVLVLTGHHPFGSPAEEQVTGFESAPALPTLELGGAATSGDTAMLTLTSGPPHAFFLLAWNHAGQVAWNGAPTAGHLPSATRFGWGPGADGAIGAVAARLSAAGEWSATLPAALLGGVHEPFFLQAAVLRPNDVAATRLVAGALRPASSRPGDASNSFARR